MGDLIDARPDRFLKEIRKHGTWERACALSGMTMAEADDLCNTNAEFDLAQVEAQLQFAEEAMVSAVEETIDNARLAMSNKLKQLRERLTKYYQLRHGDNNA